jgi:hypothetical protein
MELHHIEISEVIRDYNGGPTYAVVDYPSLPSRVLSVGEASYAETLQINTRIFEVIPWHTPGRIKPTYFGIEKTKLDLFNTLARVSIEDADRHIEYLTENEKEKWIQVGYKKGIESEREYIASLPWWERLFNDF